MHRNGHHNKVTHSILNDIYIALLIPQFDEKKKSCKYICKKILQNNVFQYFIFRFIRFLTHFGFTRYSAATCLRFVEICNDKFVANVFGV